MTFLGNQIVLAASNLLLSKLTMALIPGQDLYPKGTGGRLIGLTEMRSKE